LQVDLRQKATGLTLLSQILGTVAGIIGAVAALMGIFETGETYLRQILGEKPSKDDKKLAIYQKAWHDLVEYQATERPLLIKRQADEAYEKGLASVKMNEVPTAVGHFSDAARLGHSDAQYLLGLHKYAGNGCKQNIKDAVEIWEKAADQEHVGALYELGMYYRNSGKKDYKKSLRYLREAAEKGHRDAMYWVAISLEHGEGDRRYLPEANFWFKAAADKGDERAKAALRRYAEHMKKHQDRASEKDNQDTIEEGNEEKGESDDVPLMPIPSSSDV